MPARDCQVSIRLEGFSGSVVPFHLHPLKGLKYLTTSPTGLALRLPAAPAMERGTGRHGRAIARVPLAP